MNIAFVLTSSLFRTVRQSLLFRTEEKLVALLVYSSFVRVVTSFPDKTIFTSSGSSLSSNEE